MHPSNVFDPQSRLASTTVDLFNETLVISAVIIFAVVAGLVAHCVLRFRFRGASAEQRQVFGHKRLEIMWTVIPFLILIFILVLTARSMNASDPPSRFAAAAERT